MFFEVRIYTPKGKLKKVISREQLSKCHWNAFDKAKVIRKKLNSLMQKVDPSLELTG